MIDSINGSYLLHDISALAPTSVVATADQVLRVREGLSIMGHQLHMALTDKFPLKSFAFSPMSLAPALGMILRGMDQPLAKSAMLNTLGLTGMDEQVVHASLGQICADLITEGEGKPKVRVANGVVGQLKEIKAPYLQDLKTHYGAEVFSDQGDLLAAVNGWVNEKTEGMIPKVLAQLPRDALLCVMNALYFEADWATSFSVKDTYDMPFHCADLSFTQVRMMKGRSTVRYCEQDDLQFVEKPYQGPNGEQLSFLVILPKYGEAFRRLEVDLDAWRLSSLRQQARTRKVDLHLPKMDFEATVEDLKEILQTMGYPLDGSYREIHDQAILSSIVQKVKMQVDEKGTKAAAATVACFSRGASIDDTPKFIAARPFIFMVANKDDILFRGSIKDAEFLLKREEKVDSLSESLNAVAKIAGLDPSRLNPEQVIQHTSRGGAAFHLCNLSEHKVSYDENNRLMIDGTWARYDGFPLGCTDDDGITLILEGTDFAFGDRKGLLLYSKDLDAQTCTKLACLPEDNHWEVQVIENLAVGV